MICTDKILKKEACDVEYFVIHIFVKYSNNMKFFFPITFLKDCDMLYQIAFLCLRTLSVKKKNLFKIDGFSLHEYVYVYYI